MPVVGMLSVFDWSEAGFQVKLADFAVMSMSTSGRQKFTLVSLLTKHSEVSGGSN